MKLQFLISAILAITNACAATAVPTRWQLDPGQGGIKWEINGTATPHYDHIEMSGEQVSAVLRYGVNPNGSFSLERSMVWPMLRIYPNDTYGCVMRRFSHDFLQPILVNKQTLNNETVESISINGKLTVSSLFTVGHSRATKDNRTITPTVRVRRVIYPSTTLPMLCEKYTITNIGQKNLQLTLPAQNISYSTPDSLGVYGAYRMRLTTSIERDTTVTLSPQESAEFFASIQANKVSEPHLRADYAAELAAREAFVDDMWHSLRFESPDSTINTEFAFAKVRAAESIFRTKGGLLQSPGGEAYYAAIWANDQAEYLNPFLPYLGYDKGNESAINSFDHFARFTNAEYRCIPSSIIAEGDDYWNGAGDRGDCAMIAYGASRFALASGNRETALHLFPLIEWCLEYSKRKTTPDGVIASDSDELEGRFPSGDANLCTSTLHYDALLSAAAIARELGKKQLSAQYNSEAKHIRTAIEKHFGGEVEGFDTYRYYTENDKLRSWICMPLVAGIHNRKQATIDALLSPALLTSDGLLTQSGTNTYWDRSTLYALRGIFAAGETARALPFFSNYSSTRLLGEHVPYPIEAWPEGNQRHLSTESALYCRIVTEGIFGIRPTGFASFNLTPQLPEGWDHMALRNIAAFGREPFDIEINRLNPGRTYSHIAVKITRAGKQIAKCNIPNGSTIPVTLK